MAVWNDLKTSNAGYFPLVTGTPAWKLNFAGNVWDKLIDSIAALYDNINGNQKNITNLAQLAVSDGGSNSWTLQRDSGTGFLSFTPTQNTSSGYIFKTVIATALTEVARITNAGRLGIATNAPSGLVHVDGTALGAAASAYCYFASNLGATKPTNTFGLAVGFNYTSGNAEVSLWNSYQGGSASSFNFMQNSGGTPVQLLSLIANGAGGIIQFTECSAPGNPAAGTFYLFQDASDHKLKCRGSSGTVTILGVP